MTIHNTIKHAIKDSRSTDSVIYIHATDVEHYQALADEILPESEDNTELTSDGQWQFWGADWRVHITMPRAK